ncbi:TPA: copper chaperone CopZ [Candidatus Poribacteria bacterium]|nr:copper chaperone CopZ [Candidatus Poribacteria bacterium]
MAEKAVLKISGMSCQHCVHAVKSALESLDGVKKAKVSLDEGKVEVKYDPKKVSTERMIQAVSDAGYEAKL